MSDTSPSLYIYGTVTEKGNLHLQVVFHVPGVFVYQALCFYTFNDCTNNEQ